MLKVIIEVKKGEAVVIGKVVIKLRKSAKRGSQILERMHSNGPVESQGASKRLSEISELSNEGLSGQASYGEAECDVTAEPEESDSLDDAEYLSCDD